MPTRVPSTTAGSSHRSERGPMRTGPLASELPFAASEMPSACVSLPGPEHRSSRRETPRRGAAHLLESGDWLERPDQHAGAHALGLAHGVQHDVDAVGAIYVRATGRAEQDARARREPHERMAGWLAVVVGLGLHDHAGATAVRDRAADQLACDVERLGVRRTQASKPASSGHPTLERRAPFGRVPAARARERARCRPPRSSTRATSSRRARVGTPLGGRPACRCVRRAPRR